jgi:hemoglobin-like flavoprotein
MTEQDIKCIKKSWALLRHIKPEIIADTFYSKLFLDNPSLRRMFPIEMQGQYEKLMSMLTTIIVRLDRLDELQADIEAMGVRHHEYGVKPRHYTMVSDALLWTLEKGLAHDWNEETAAAWQKCYNLLSESMINAKG